MRRGRVWRAMRWILGALGVCLILFLITPTGRYLLRAAWEEGKILARRRRIVELVVDTLPNAEGVTTVDRPTKAKLELVLQARAFAAESIHLQTRASFTTYSPLDHDTLVLVLSGAYRDRLKPYTWWFPVVGRVPYKGYFDFRAARDAERDLQRRGFDTYLRPASAFSTLGWFNDPLLPTTLRADSVNLVNTVIHEVTHNTFYAPGQAVFNESFANFVGARGAAWFFRARGDTVAARRADDDWHDDQIMGRFWSRLHASIDSAYGAHAGKTSADSLARLAARDSVYTRARRELVEAVGPELRTIPAAWLRRIPLDNAALLARRIYLTDLDVFDAVYERQGRDLRRTIDAVVKLARSKRDDPFAALRAAHEIPAASPSRP
jgi:predicted aminopeptidase